MIGVGDGATCYSIDGEVSVAFMFDGDRRPVGDGDGVLAVCFSFLSFWSLFVCLLRGGRFYDRKRKGGGRGEASLEGGIHFVRRVYICDSESLRGMYECR